jgi:hypothetical protein
MRRCHVTLGLSRHGFNKNNDFNCDCRYWLFTLADWSTQNAKFRSWKGVPAGAGYFADPTLALDTCPNLISTIQSTCRRYPRISGTFSSLNSFGEESSEDKKTGGLWVTSPGIMKGYFKNPKEKTKTILVCSKRNTCWLHTGYIAYFDSRGCLYSVDEHWL